MAQRQGLREVVQQKSDEFGVQFHAGEAGEVIAGTPNAPRPLIGAGRKQGVKDIGDRDPSQMTWTWWEMFCYGMLDLAKRTGLDCTS